MVGKDIQKEIALACVHEAVFLPFIRQLAICCYGSVWFA